MRALFAALVMCLTFGTFTTPTADGAAMDTMSKRRAGTYYLDAACDYGSVQDMFYRRVWRGRDTISRAEVARRLPEIRRVSSRMGIAHYRFARRMYNPPRAWPGYVSAPITRLADAHLRGYRLRSAQGNAATARQWLRLNGRFNRIRWGNNASIIRSRLNLPPSGRGC